MTPSERFLGAARIDGFAMVASLWREKWVLTLCAAVAVLLGGIYAFVLAEPRFSAGARMVFQANDQSVFSFEQLVPGAKRDSEALNTEMEVVRSWPLIRELVVQLELTGDPEFAPQLQSSGILNMVGLGSRQELTDEDILRSTTNAVRNAISVIPQRNTYLFTISAETESAEKSILIANTLARIYLDNQVEKSFDSTEYAVNWLSERVIELELELKEKEDQYRDLRLSSDLVSPEALDELTIRTKSIRDRYEQVTADIAAANVDTFDQLIAAGDLAGLSELTGIAAPGADASPTAREAFLAEVGRLRNRRQEAVTQQQGQADALRASLAQLEEQIRQQNQELLNLSNLQREVDAIQVLYETFLARLKETSVQLGMTQAESSVLSEAEGGQLVAPHKPLIMAVSLLLGLIAGSVYILLRQFRSTTFRTGEALETATGLSVLGQIPKLKFTDRHKLLQYVMENPTSAFVEALRNLRTSIMMSNLEQPPQIVLITSSVPGEGKTTQAITLAQNFSGLRKRVLLIEGDIRRTVHKEYFGEAQGGNLIQVLAGTSDLDRAIEYKEDIGIDVLPGGHTTESAADVFASTEFRKLMNDVRSRYDLVVIDTPPVLVVPDARIISPHVDGVYYCVKWDMTGVHQVQSGIQMFESIGVKVSGLILTQVDSGAMKRYGYGDRYGAYQQYAGGYYNG